MYAYRNAHFELQVALKAEIGLKGEELIGVMEEGKAKTQYKD